LALIPTGDSCIVGTPITAIDCQISEYGRQMLEALHATDLGEGLSYSRWTAISDVAERTAARWQKTLVEMGLVGSHGEGRLKRYSVTDLGKRELEK
jgi:predicted transcriptional regulator